MKNTETDQTLGVALELQNNLLTVRNNNYAPLGVDIDGDFQFVRLNENREVVVSLTEEDRAKLDRIEKLLERVLDALLGR